MSDQQLYNQVEVSSIILFLAFYAVMSAYLEHKKLPIHKGAVAIIIGIIVGLFISISSQAAYNKLVKMNETIIFTILLPPMLFAQGYTFKKNAFIKNLKFIIVFGVVGTFVSYVVVSALVYAANDLNLIRDAKDINVVRTLSIWQVLLFSACLCSIETGASEEAINQNKYPKVFSILTGQGILKDCVTIVLFRAILNLQEMENPHKFIFYWYTSFVILKNFLIMIVGSLAFGILAGMATSYLLKKLRFLMHDKGVSQTTVLFLIGYATYILTEVATFSGIISILTFGIILNRYNSYNLSEEGSKTSKNTFLFVSVICEGLLFLIMGVMVWQVQWDQDTPTHHMTHSYIFCLVVIVILVIGRIVNIYLMWLLVRFVFSSFKMNKQELKIIFISGLVRGATPFALFTSVEFKQGSTHYGRNEGLVLKTTIIIITMFSSIILNSIIPQLYSKPLQEIKKQAKMQMVEKLKEEEQKIKEKKFKNSLNKLSKFEQEKIKPLLIFNYESRKQQIEKEKHEKKAQVIRTTLEKMDQQEVSEEERHKLKASLLEQSDVI